MRVIGSIKAKDCFHKVAWGAKGFNDASSPFHYGLVSFLSPLFYTPPIIFCCLSFLPFSSSPFIPPPTVINSLAHLLFTAISSTIINKNP